MITENNLKKILIALAIYLTSLIAANTLGLKLIPFLFDSHLSVAVFSFPFVFLTTDVIGEVFGKQMAKYFVLAGFISTALFTLYSIVSLAVPWSADALWAKESYNSMFGISVRISIASLVAFSIAEYQDVVAFFMFQKKWGQKYFWLRSLLSNIWSQLLDSVIFSIIAFLGVYSLPTLISATFTWWLYKVAMGFLYTPLSYIGVKLLTPNNHDSKSN